MVVKPNFSVVVGHDLLVNHFGILNIFGIHRQYSIALSPCSLRLRLRALSAFEAWEKPQKLQTFGETPNKIVKQPPNP